MLSAQTPGEQYNAICTDMTTVQTSGQADSSAGGGFMYVGVFPSLELVLVCPLEGTANARIRASRPILIPGMFFNPEKLLRSTEAGGMIMPLRGWR